MVSGTLLVAGLKVHGWAALVRWFVDALQVLEVLVYVETVIEEARAVSLQAVVAGHA